MKSLFILISLFSFSAFAGYTDYLCESDFSYLSLRGRVYGQESQMSFSGGHFDIDETGVKGTLSSLQVGSENFIVLTLTKDGVKIADVKAPMNQQVSLKVPLTNSFNEVYGHIDTNCGTDIYKESVAVDGTGRESIKDVSDSGNTQRNLASSQVSAQ